MSFKTVLTALGLPYPDNNIDVYANSLTNELYACSKECGNNESSGDIYHRRDGRYFCRIKMAVKSGAQLISAEN